MYRIYRDGNKKLFVETDDLKFAEQINKEETKKGHSIKIVKVRKEGKKNDRKNKLGR